MNYIKNFVKVCYEETVN